MIYKVVVSKKYFYWDTKKVFLVPTCNVFNNKKVFFRLFSIIFAQILLFFVSV